MSGLVFGTGFLGSRISEFFNYKAVSHKEVDVCDFSSITFFLDNYKKIHGAPEIVINATGVTGYPSIDWCEDHKEETLRVNVGGVINLATACFERGIYFVQLGSGCLYRGDNEGKGFNEDDEPNIEDQYYAKTKIWAEQVLRKFPCLILRLRMPIDDRPHPRNLIDKLSKYSSLLSSLNSITAVPSMLQAMKVLTERKKTGVYNFTNPGKISPLEIMRLYYQIVKEERPEPASISLEELDKITKAKRSNCYLDTTKLEKELKGSEAEMPEINEAVKQCLINYKEAIKK